MSILAQIIGLACLLFWGFWLWGLYSPWRSAVVTKFCPSCSPRVCWPFAALLGC